MADKARIHLPHLKSTIRLYERLKAQGGAELDHSALHKLLWQDANPS